MAGKSKREFQNGPLASNVVFGFILTVLERLVETEFECPCKEKCNGGFVAAFFIIPGILAFVLMASVQRPKCSCHCLVPAFVWMILLVFDGRYIACAMTDWSGRYVTADKATPLKWCEPENGTSYQDRLKDSQDWYFHSQWAGLGLVLVLALPFLWPFVWALVLALFQFFVWAKDRITKCIGSICSKEQQNNSPAQSQPGVHASPGTELPKTE